MKLCLSNVRSASTKLCVTRHIKESTLKTNLSPIEKHGKPGPRQVTTSRLSKRHLVALPATKARRELFVAAAMHAVSTAVYILRRGPH